MTIGLFEMGAKSNRIYYSNSTTNRVIANPTLFPEIGGNERCTHRVSGRTHATHSQAFIEPLGIKINQNFN